MVSCFLLLLGTPYFCYLIYDCFSFFSFSIWQVQTREVPLLLQKSLATRTKERLSALCPCGFKVAKDSVPQTKARDSRRQKVYWYPRHIKEGLCS